MKALNVRNMRNTRQSGFTIIELVVVILLAFLQPQLYLAFWM